MKHQHAVNGAVWKRNSDTWRNDELGFDNI